MRQVICDYCGHPAEYVDSAVIYHGQSYGMMYLCRPCDAYVGVHKGTDAPLGRLANAELRRWKKAAHAAFDPLWKGGQMRRSQAYVWLSKRMGISTKEMHIGLFDVEQCKQAVTIIKNERMKVNGILSPH